MSINTRAKRTAAIALAAGLALAPATAGMAAAQTNVDIIGDVAWSQNISNINPNQTGSITVHKYLNPTATGEPTGNAGQDVTNAGQQLSGVEFTARKITGDVTDPAEFQRLANLTPQEAITAGQFDGTAQTITTSNGSGTFSDLPVGAYLVEETDTSGANIDGTNVSGQIIPADPFIVFVPMTNPENTTEWNYNPVVYPKNTNTTVTKAVEDAGDHVGAELEYTITTGIPSVETGDTMQSYTITDDIDETRLDITADQESRIVATLSNGTELIKGTDYTVTVDAATKLVTVNFLEPGLQKLTQAGASAQVLTTIPATKVAIGATGMSTFNDATLIGNNGNSDFNLTSEPVESRHGKLQINKTGEAGTEQLAGAEFQLYQCTDENTLGAQITALPVSGGNEAFTTDGTTWTTNAEGQIVIDGLQVTDWQDGAAVADPASYCLVETKAPEGYELNPDPIVVEFTTEAVANTADGTNEYTQLATVTNVTERTEFLPNTGGMGVGLLILAGAGIVGAGAYAARRNSAEA